MAASASLGSGAWAEGIHGFVGVLGLRKASIFGPGVGPHRCWRPQDLDDAVVQDGDAVAAMRSRRNDFAVISVRLQELRSYYVVGSIRPLHRALCPRGRGIKALWR